MDKKINLFILNKSDFCSIFQDIFSMALLLGGFFVNHHYIGSNNFLDIILTSSFLLYSVYMPSKSIKKYQGKKEIKQFCEEYLRMHDESTYKEDIRDEKFNRKEAKWIISQ